MSYIPVSDVVASRLIAPKPPLKKIGKDNVNYTITYMKYNCGTENEHSVNKVLFQLNITKCQIIMFRDKLRLRVYLCDQGDIEGLSQLSKGFAYCVDKYKEKFNLRNFDPKNPGDLRGAFYYLVDEMGEEMREEVPRMDLKINHKSKFQIPRPDSDEFDEIDPKELVGKEIECSIIFNPDHLRYDYGRPIPQIFVQSCIILDIRDIEIEHTIDDTVTDFIKKNPNKIYRLSKVVSKLTVKPQAELPLSICSPCPEARPVDLFSYAVTSKPLPSLPTMSEYP